MAADGQPGSATDARSSSPAPSKTASYAADAMAWAVDARRASATDAPGAAADARLVSAADAVTDRDDAIAPGRIDLGLGRAPGSDGRDLLAWLAGEPIIDKHPFAAVKAYPQGDTAPKMWILGRSNYGAQVAAHFGLPHLLRLVLLRWPRRPTSGGVRL